MFHSSSNITPGQEILFFRLYQCLLLQPNRIEVINRILKYIKNNLKSNIIQYLYSGTKTHSI